ncbi:VOC family protein [Reyranella sp.]|uniref:VOC family protein n=1 Tax=Reyranella sp. TaxID=1929291 RepID=UPI003BAB2488
MIDFLDHLALAGPVADYETLLGRRAVDGRLQAGNVGLTFGAAGAPLSSMVFATASLDRAERLLGRRGVATTRGRQLELAAAATHGVPIALVERAAAPPPSPLLADEASAVSGLDHVVIRSPHPERAIAFYAGRLGLDLRLDRGNPAWGARLLFFRCGDLVVEIAHDLEAGISDAPDTLWGLSWRVPAIAAAHARLKAAGLDVSAPRAGRRPGTEVFGVSNGTAGVPTLVIAGAARW